MISLYQACIPPSLRALGALDAVLAKAAEHCEAHKIDPAALLTARLFPDMFPLTRQVQIAADMVKLAAFRLVGDEAPKQPDTETSFPELRARIESVAGLVNAIPESRYEGSETRAIVVPMRVGQLDFTGLSYVQTFVLPNVYFHVATAYNILRHNGVVLGKRDFLGTA